MTEEQEKLLLDIKAFVKKNKIKIVFNKFSEDEELLCLLFLDPYSFKLPFFKLSRDYWYLIDKTRTKLLKGMLSKQEQAGAELSQAQDSYPVFFLALVILGLIRLPIGSTKYQLSIITKRVSRESIR